MVFFNARVEKISENVKSFDKENSKLRLKILTLVLTCLLLSIQGCYTQPTRASAYWIWAGILPDEAPAEAPILLYQGNIVLENGVWGFNHKGVYPYPINKKSIQLVFRLHHLPAPEFIIDLFRSQLSEWKRHGVHVDGLQLDFDSPSAKLGDYANFLQRLRQHLRQQIKPQVGLSITGLGTWLSDTDSDTLAAIHAPVDYIAYQFYVGRKTLSHPQPYLNFLARNPHPFKIGLLANEPHLMGEEILANNPAYLGKIFFIQR